MLCSINAILEEESPYKPDSVEEFRRIDTLVLWLQKIRCEKLPGIVP